MTKIIGVFGNQAAMTHVLDELYRHDIEQDDVGVMRNAGARGDGTIENTATGRFIIPAIYPSQNTGATFPAVNFSGHSFVDDADLGDESMAFYKRTADSGGFVVMVDADETHKDTFANLFRQNQATRVDFVG